MSASSTGNGNTFWCHECDMSITLFCSSSSSSSNLCPHCRTNFLENMDIPFIDVTASPGQDTSYMLDSPYLQALISQLSDDPDSFNPHAASKESVNSLPSIKITNSSAPELECAICKDVFVVDTEAKKLPCGHIYHPDCILPWLRQQNSCPLCRFCLPTEEELDPASRVDVVSGMNFVDEDLYGLRGTLRIIARRHGMDLPRSGDREEVSVVAAQIGDGAVGLGRSGLVEIEEMVLGDVQGSSLEDAAEALLSEFGM